MREKSIFTIRSPGCVSVRPLENLSEPWFPCSHKSFYKDICLSRSLWNINKRVYVKAPRPRPWCKVSLMNVPVTAHTRTVTPLPQELLQVQYISLQSPVWYQTFTCIFSNHARAFGNPRCALFTLWFGKYSPRHPSLLPQLGPPTSRPPFFFCRKKTRAVGAESVLFI